MRQAALFFFPLMDDVEQFTLSIPAFSLGELIDRIGMVVDDLLVVSNRTSRDRSAVMSTRMTLQRQALEEAGDP